MLYRIWKINELKEDCYKYVRVGNEFRFCPCMIGGHAELLAEGEKATSAAFLHVFKTYIRVEDYSSTLKLGPASDDGELLAKALGRQLKDD